jgi:hypothetical protein
MNKRNLLMGIALAGALALTASETAAQIGIGTTVIGAGGTNATSGGVVLLGTVGQTVIGPTTATHTAWQGFWYTQPGPPPVVSVPVEYVAGSATSGEMALRSWPNPFSQETELRVTLHKSGPVSLKLYNSLGREIETLLDGTYEAGTLLIRIDGRDFESGSYMAQLIAEGRQQAIRLIVVK